MPDLPTRWVAFRNSVYFTAAVLVVILTIGAGLFAASYTYAMANPEPKAVPVANVVGFDVPERQEEFLKGIQRVLDASLIPIRYDSWDAARYGIEHQEVHGVIGPTERGVELAVTSAGGYQVAQLLTDAGRAVGNDLGVEVEIRDLTPLQDGDPRGLALFYLTLASILIGFVGAMNLRAHAEELPPPGRLAFTAVYSSTGAFAIVGVVTGPLGAIDLPFAEAWAILALTAFTTGMVGTMFNTLFGRWGILPTWGLLVLIGNPSSGGVVSWPLLPFPFSVIGPWLPAGASIEALHTAVYFPDAQHPFPFLVLVVWSVFCASVFWIWRHRHPTGVLVRSN